MRRAIEVLAKYMVQMEVFWEMLDMEWERFIWACSNWRGKLLGQMTVYSMVR